MVPARVPPPPLGGDDSDLKAFKKLWEGEAQSDLSLPNSSSMPSTPLTQRISRWRLDLQLADTMVADVHKVSTDESWHGKVSDDLQRQLVELTGTPAVLASQPQFIRGSSRPFRDPRILAAVRELVCDHAQDEGRHRAPRHARRPRRRSSGRTGLAASAELRDRYARADQRPGVRTARRPEGVPDNCAAALRVLMALWSEEQSRIHPASSPKGGRHARAHRDHRGRPAAGRGL